LVGDFIKWLTELPHLSPGQQFKEVAEAFLKILGFTELVKFLYRRAFRKRSRLERKIADLEDEIVDQRSEITKKSDQLKAARNELTAIKLKSLEHAMTVANREWQDNNVDSANYALEQWLSGNVDQLTDATLAMAKYHIAHAIPDPADHLIKARNMLQVARTLSPAREELHSLWFEFDLVNAALQKQVFYDGTQQIGWNANMQREPLIQTFRDAALYCMEKGQWLLAPLFAQRAVDLARSAGPSLRRILFICETEAAGYESSAGKRQEALHRIDRALAVGRDFLKESDFEVLEARGWKVSILLDLNKDAEALVEVDRLIPKLIEMLGLRNPNSLSAKLARARALSGVGRADEALTEIDDLMPIRRDVFGARHPSTCTTQFYRAQILAILGRFDEALAVVDEAAPIQLEVLGANHPDVIAMQLLHANVLNELGRDSEALDLIETWLPIQTKVLGPQHPTTSMYQGLRQSILEKMKGADSAPTAA
jgi:tetratricopeptide (TPR) repeat protein